MAPDLAKFPPETDRKYMPTNRVIALWLLVCALLIFIMVVLGGVTRLTRSGLSIVEWAPIMGAIPPLNETQWESTFEKYRRSPEFNQVNTKMDLSGFKEIFWIEYTHRLLGRLIGITFLLPFLYFMVRRWIDRALALKLTMLFILGGLQGVLGWYMVASGLIDIPRVSPYRLTAHLGLAIAIYGYIVWIALTLLDPQPLVARLTQPLTRFSYALTALVFLMILSGGFVAGTRAGFAFNTFPLMNGRVIPEGLFGLEPWWVNFFENVATVQFDHRLLAYTLIIAISIFWLMARRFDLPLRARTATHVLAATLILQILLGITTLIHIVPIPLAAAHQAGALVLFTAALWTTHTLRTV